MSKAARTKQFIIEKTAPIFNTKGYAGTSINDLTFATGLTKGSIYGNFDNKDEVALAAFDYNFMRVNLYIKSQMETQTSIIGKLLVYPQTYRNFLKLPFLAAGCPITNTSTEADDTHPLLRSKATAAFTYWRKTLEFLINKGISEGEIKADLQVQEFISILTSLIQGSFMQTKVTGNLNALYDSMDFLEKLIRNLKA